MAIITMTSRELSIATLLRLGRYRYQVFIQTLGWQLNATDGMEFDQFDDERTVHLIAEDEEGTIVGYGRLLRTDRPYLLGEVFPQLLGGHAPPCSRTVWELSRFAAMDFRDEQADSPSQFSSPVALEVLYAAIRFCASQGGESLISVSPLGIERWLRKAGLAARRGGPAMVVDGYALFACWLDLQAAMQSCAPDWGMLRRNAQG